MKLAVIVFIALLCVAFFVGLSAKKHKCKKDKKHCEKPEDCCDGFVCLWAQKEPKGKIQKH